jgi:hypothetical protein
MEMQQLQYHRPAASFQLQQLRNPELLLLQDL